MCQAITATHVCYFYECQTTVSTNLILVNSEASTTRCMHDAECCREYGLSTTIQYPVLVFDVRQHHVHLGVQPDMNFSHGYVTDFILKSQSIVPPGETLVSTPFEALDILT